MEQVQSLRVVVETNQFALDQVISAVLHESSFRLGHLSNMDIAGVGDSVGIVDWSAFKRSQKRECLYFERYYNMCLIDISGTLPIQGRRTRLQTPFRWPDLIEVLKGDSTFARG